MQRGWITKSGSVFMHDQMPGDVPVVILTAAEFDAREAVVKAAMEMFAEAEEVPLDDLVARINRVGEAINALDALEGE